MRWFKRILPWALGASIVAALVWAYLPKPVQVDLASATRGSFEMTVTEPGKTRVRLRYTVTAPSSGVLARVVVRPGDVVDAGEVLSRIRPLDSPLLDARTRAQAAARVRATSAAREQAMQQLERARGLLGLARVDLERQLLLARAGTAPARDLQVAEIDELTRRKEAEAAEWAVLVATSELESARAVLRRLETRSIDQVEVRAPARGAVLRVFQESEGPVAVGAPLVEIGDPGELEIAVDLLTPDAVRVLPGAEARLDQWGGNRPFAARVRRVEPGGFTRISALGVEEQRVTVVLDPVERIAALGDGFRVEVTITLFAAPDVLQVPASAVFRTDGTWSLYVAAAGRLELRAVEIGHRSDTTVEVLRGITAGDRVLVHPTDRVRDGVRYTARAVSTSGA